MNDRAWEHLKTSPTYKIYRAPDGWWDPFPYTVARPDGSVLTCTATIWGARWAIRRAIRKGDRKKVSFWGRSLVEEIDPGGDRRG